MLAQLSVIQEKVNSVSFQKSSFFIQITINLTVTFHSIKLA